MYAVRGQGTWIYRHEDDLKANGSANSDGTQPVQTYHEFIVVPETDYLIIQKDSYIDGVLTEEHFPTLLIKGDPPDSLFNVPAGTRMLGEQPTDKAADQYVASEAYRVVRRTPRIL